MKGGRKHRSMVEIIEEYRKEPGKVMAIYLSKHDLMNKLESS